MLINFFFKIDTYFFKNMRNDKEPKTPFKFGRLTIQIFSSMQIVTKY